MSKPNEVRPALIFLLSHHFAIILGEPDPAASVRDGGTRRKTANARNELAPFETRRCVALGIELCEGAPEAAHQVHEEEESAQ